MEILKKKLKVGELTIIVERDGVIERENFYLHIFYMLHNFYSLTILC